MTPSNPTQPLRVRVSRTSDPAQGIRMLSLQPADAAGPLPAFEAGAHISVAVTLPDGQQDRRQYSLIDLEGSPNSHGTPAEYVIAVRLDESGRGGSRFMHQGLGVGDTVDILPPRNDFPLKPSSRRAFLIAGGIGVTPLASMAAACVAQGRPVRMVYAGRGKASMALAPELSALLGDSISLHCDEEVGGPIDLQSLFGEIRSEDEVYACGPTPMLDALIAEAARRQWAPDRLNFELFGAAKPLAGDGAFDLVLARTQRTLVVPADQSILDVLIAEGLDPLYDCKRGECGVCAVDVVSGEVDHRDYVLTDREKATNKVMHMCVSRCKGKTLVIDL